MAEEPNIKAEADAAPPHRPRSVYVIDDDVDVRKSLHFLLATYDITARPFSGAGDFLDELPMLNPAPILLDIRMPEIDGIQLLEILKERQVQWPVIVMTAHGDLTIAVRAMKLGAIEFLEKPFQPDLINLVFDQVFEDLEKTEALVCIRNDARKQIAQLSRRESEIVAILMEGVPNKTVAHRLGLSVRTVEMHRGNAFAKLGFKSIAEVIALAASAEVNPRDLGSLCRSR